MTGISEATYSKNINLDNGWDMHIKRGSHTKPFKPTSEKMYLKRGKITRAYAVNLLDKNILHT
jgi:hypothetical protein